jgi:hypothetical protein
MDQLLAAAIDIVRQYGLAGAVILFLAYYVLMQRADLKDTRAANKVELEAKEKLINQLQEARLDEMRAGFEIAKTNQITLSALTSALQGRHRDR